MNKQEIIAVLKEKKNELAKLRVNISKSPSMKAKGSLVTRNVNGTIRLFCRTGKTEQICLQQ